MKRKDGQSCFVSGITINRLKNQRFAQQITFGNMFTVRLKSPQNWRRSFIKISSGLGLRQLGGHVSCKRNLQRYAAN